MINKKRILASIIALVAIIGSATASPRYSQYYDSETNMNMVQLYASRYLDSYGVSLSSKGNGLMCVSYTVYGTRTMDKIGVDKILVEEWDGDEWVKHGDAYGSSNEDFYAYNESEHIGNFYFYGLPGMKYKATITAYAGLGSGSDTGTVTSFTCYC